MHTGITFIGVDPGVTGAVAVVQYARDYFAAGVADLPVTPDTFLSNQSKSLDIPAFAGMLENYTACNRTVVFATEQMQSMGFRTPAKVLTMLAEMAGSLETAVRLTCRHKNLPLFIRKYQPKVWTHWLFPNSDKRTGRKAEAKEESLEKAKMLFPDLKNMLNLKKYHDRAEALLLTFTVFAEIHGCRIDPKLQRFGDLVTTYRRHSQSSQGLAIFSHIYNSEDVPKNILGEEIKQKREQGAYQ